MSQLRMPIGTSSSKSLTRNVLRVFNELEGCRCQETRRRQCWSIVEVRWRRRGTLPARPTEALCSPPGASSRPCDAPASRRPSLLPETRTQSFENTQYIPGQALRTADSPRKVSHPLRCSETGEPNLRQWTVHKGENREPAAPAMREGGHSASRTSRWPQ